jgi:hypothetical protein
VWGVWVAEGCCSRQPINTRRWNTAGRPAYGSIRTDARFRQGLQDLHFPSSNHYRDLQGDLPRLPFLEGCSSPSSEGQIEDLSTLPFLCLHVPNCIKTTINNNNSGYFRFRICFPSSQHGLSKIRAAGDPRLPTHPLRLLLEFG